MDDPAPSVPAAGRPGWKFWLRIAVSAALLALLVLKGRNLHGIFPKRHHGRTAVLLGAAIVMTFIGIMLSAWRWQRVLALFDVRARIRTLTSHYLAGIFVGNVLPSTIGGDVVRVTRGSSLTGSTTTSFASVVLERLTGMVALPLLVFVAFAVRPSLLDVDHAWTAMLVAGITVTGLALVLLLAGHPRLAGRFAERGNWTRFIGAIHLGVDRMRRQPLLALYVLATSIVYQVSVVLTMIIVFHLLDLPVPTAAAFAYVPAVSMVQVLPLSFNGLGVREGMLVWFLHPLGIRPAQAIAAGLLWLLCTLAVSALGAPLFAAGGGQRRTGQSSESVAEGAA